MNRFIDISSPGKLSISQGCLRFEPTDGDLSPSSIPLVDIASIVVSSPSITFSGRLLCALAENEVPLTICNDNFAPTAVVTPMLPGKARFGAVFEAQKTVSIKKKKQIWAEIVKAKITNQATLLKLLGCSFDISKSISNLLPGDPRNIEAQVAREYWPRVFGDGFLRDRTAPDANALLNYAYGILRNSVLRSLGSAGLFPTFGIHHSNERNSTCLADDIIEPLRPFADLSVSNTLRKDFNSLTNVNCKRSIAEVLSFSAVLDARPLPLSEVIQPYVLSFRECLLSDSALIQFPILDSESCGS
jgi:CRISPR-associated protein Cas1